MINFNQLPQENPNKLVEPGLYYGTITKAEMTQPQDVSSNPYMKLTIALSDARGIGRGELTDRCFETGSPAIQYKLARLIRACNIPLQGAMELKDLCRIVLNKQIVVDVNHSKKTEKYEPQAQVNLFDHECYYLPSEFTEAYRAIYGEPTDEFEVTEQAPVPFADAPVTTARQAVPPVTTTTEY